MVIAFVPVRSGSKSIPLKNIKSFCGRPLLYWVLRSLQDAQRVDRVYVGTDGEEIKAAVRSFGFSKVEMYDRDPEHATDTSSTESVMLEFLNKTDFSDEDTFVLVQATSPFTQAKDIDAALASYESGSADSVVTCVRVKRFFWDADGNALNYDYTARPRRQEFDGTLMENGAFYIHSVGGIRKHKNRLGKNVSVYEMPAYTATEIDEEDDWIVAEHLMRRCVLKEDV